MSDYWCSSCEDTTVVRLSGNGYKACVICKLPCGLIKDVIMDLRDTAADLRDTCASKKEAIEAENKQLLLDRRNCHMMIGRLARNAAYNLKWKAIDLCTQQDPNAFSPLRENDDE